jgi:hypothetical protein
MFDDMPKVELHVHLDGALPPWTVLQLAEQHNMYFEHFRPIPELASYVEWVIRTSGRTGLTKTPECLTSSRKTRPAKFAQYSPQYSL